MMTHMQINCFLTVAKYLSFSEAARQLFIAQSAVSRQIIALEKLLDLQLFERTNRKISLTPAGEVLYRELQKYDDWLAHIVNMAKQARHGKTGALNIGILHGIVLSDSSALLFQTFSKEHPNIQLNIKRLVFQDVVSELLMGTIDLIITLSFLVPCHTNIAQCVIESDRDKIIVSKALDIGNMETINPQDLLRHTFVAISPDISCQANANGLNYLHGKGVTPVNVKLVNTIEDIMLSVESGLGFGVANCFTRLSNRSHIRFFDLYEGAGQDTVTDVVAVWHKNCVNPSVMSFIRFISGLAAGDN